MLQTLTQKELSHCVFLILTKISLCLCGKKCTKKLFTTEEQRI